jgi:hypothetical protein
MPRPHEPETFTVPIAAPQAPVLADRRIAELLAATGGDVDQAVELAKRLPRFSDVDAAALRRYAHDFARWRAQHQRFVASRLAFRPRVQRRSPAVRTRSHAVPPRRQGRAPGRRSRRAAGRTQARAPGEPDPPGRRSSPGQAGRDSDTRRAA